jgi:hypothetical protein
MATGRTRGRARATTAEHRRGGLAGRAEESGNLTVLGKAAPLVLRPDQAVFDDHVELPSAAGCDLCVDADRVAKLDRETRGSCVVSASGGAVEDLDGHADNLIGLQFLSVPAALGAAG